MEKERRKDGTGWEKKVGKRCGWIGEGLEQGYRSGVADSEKDWNREKKWKEWRRVKGWRKVGTGRRS